MSALAHPRPIALDVDEPVFSLELFQECLFLFLVVHIAGHRSATSQHDADIRGLDLRSLAQEVAERNSFPDAELCPWIPVDCHDPFRDCGKSFLNALARHSRQFRP